MSEDNQEQPVVLSSPAARTSYDVEPTDPKWVHQQKMEVKRLEAGWFGSLFGVENAASTNIAGLAVVGGLLTLLILGVLSTRENAANGGLNEAMKYVAPIITAALGYLFGSRRSDD